jgi:hypothetical protein
MSSAHVRVLLRGANAVAICRDFEVPCAMACLSCTHDAIEHFRSKFHTTPTSVLVSTRKKDRRTEIPQHLAPGDINLLNLCGKISHATNTDNGIFNRGCVPMLTTIKDGFGVRISAATIYGNFVTSPHANTTLFRGCKRCTDVLRAIDLIFKSGVVHEVVIHMVVAMTVLPHAVCMSAAQIARALHEHPAWQAQTPPSLEDNVYMQPVQLSYGDKKVLVHVYATGAIFFFVTCNDKTVMRPDSELEFVRICREIYRCVERVC